MADDIQPLKVQVFTANCGNGSIGPKSSSKILDGFFPSAEKPLPKPHVIVVNLQEADFNKTAIEMVKAVRQREAEGLFDSLKDYFAPNTDPAIITAILLEMLSYKKIQSTGLFAVKYETYYEQLRAFLKTEETGETKRAIVNQMQLAVDRRKMVILTEDKMITRTNTNASLSFKTGTAGIAQLLIVDPVEVEAVRPLKKSQRSPSPRVNRRRAILPMSFYTLLPFGPTYNKGGKRHQLLLTLKGQSDKPFRLDMVSGHLESKGPKDKGRSKRIIDFMNSLLPREKVVLRAENYVDENFADLSREAPHSLCTGFDMNTRDLLIKPQLEVRLNSKGKLEAGLIDADFNQGSQKAIDCWADEAGRADPGIHPFLQCTPATHRWGGKNTFAEQKTCKWLGKSLSTGDVHQERVSSYNGNLDQVTALFDDDDLNAESHSADNEIKVEPGESQATHKRDHSVIKSAVGTVNYRDEFERVKVYISRALRGSAPQLSESLLSLNDCEDSRATLVRVYHYYLDSGGLLERRLTLQAKKLACADKLQLALLNHFKGLAEAEAQSQETTELLSDEVGCNRQFESSWRYLQHFERNVLFEELYTPDNLPLPWFAASEGFHLSKEQLELKIRKDEARFSIEEKAANILLRLLKKPDDLVLCAINADNQPRILDNSVLISEKDKVILSQLCIFKQHSRRSIEDFECALAKEKRDAVDKIWALLEHHLKQCECRDEVMTAFNLCQQAIDDLKVIDTPQDIDTLTKNTEELLEFNHLVQEAKSEIEASASHNNGLQPSSPGRVASTLATTLIEPTQNSLSQASEEEDQEKRAYRIADRKDHFRVVCLKNQEKIVRYNGFQKLWHKIKKVFGWDNAKDRLFEAENQPLASSPQFAS